jgi:CheY-like chemotaxis protein
LVEDSEDDAFFFRWTMEKSGLPCEITHAMDGAAAVRYLEDALEGAARIPDLVFLDLKLPTFSGFEVLEWIRTRNFSPLLDVAVLSGSEHSSDVARARALGVTAYYAKPLSVAQLRERFDAWQQHPSLESVTGRTIVAGAQRLKPA